MQIITLNQIGNFTLSLSLVGYLFFLLPQIWHNTLNRTKIYTLSVGLHLIMLGAYICDLFYGYGLSMPWQYRLVTIVGLGMLSIQHLQIWIYRRAEIEFQILFRSITLGILGFTFLLGYLYFQGKLSESLLLTIGAISQIGWFTAVLPQIHKNFRLKSAAGLSLHFILLGIFLSTCDAISAWLLDWKLPNKIGAPFLILVKLVLLWQYFDYRVVPEPIHDGSAQQ
ncbi:MAG: PQ-loop repeat-containing protein [Candidatus Caenarcaniphilales bacterium]|nr:PQ-loop repeat-containing protein [Candidatus Caenarcaniphilales bacterium]